MGRLSKAAIRWGCTCGLDKMSHLWRLPGWALEYFRFVRQSRAVKDTMAAPLFDAAPYLADRTAATGFDRHYIYHTAWAARVLARTRPEEHVDIGSALYFSGITSAFVPIRYFDYRPADLSLDGLRSEAADLCHLPFGDRSLRSVSCLHVIEHVGLGRYGDPLDPQGDRRALRELQRVTAPGGDLLVVMPVGRPRVCFNGHRVYAPAQVISALPELVLHHFALVPDCAAAGGLVVDGAMQLAEKQEYGCGCFWFKRQVIKRDDRR